MTTPALISIEGNIGSGKTTLFRALAARNPDWHLIEEPVESWMAMKNERGESLLELFYKDKRRWAYTFQNTALLTRLRAIRDTIRRYDGKGVFLTERCVHTDAQVFARLMRDDGEMDALESELYTMWFETFAAEMPAPVAYIHVDTPVTVCHERIAARSREGEEGSAIPIEYLDKLDSAHFRWLRGGSLQEPLLRFDNISKDQTPIEVVERFIRAQLGGRMAEVD